MTKRGKIPVGWFSKRRMAAIDAVLAELNKYGGEIIVANKYQQHPLHAAVVALEDLLDNRRGTDRSYSTAAGRYITRQNLLLPPAVGAWFAILQKSRGRCPTSQFDYKQGDPRDVLKSILLSWKEQEPDEWKVRLWQLGMASDKVEKELLERGDIW